MVSRLALACIVCSASAQSVGGPPPAWWVTVSFIQQTFPTNQMLLQIQNASSSGQVTSLLSQVGIGLDVYSSGTFTCYVDPRHPASGPTCWFVSNYAPKPASTWSNVYHVALNGTVISKTQVNNTWATTLQLDPATGAVYIGGVAPPGATWGVPGIYRVPATGGSYKLLSNLTEYIAFGYTITPGGAVLDVPNHCMYLHVTPWPVEAGLARSHGAGASDRHSYLANSDSGLQADQNATLLTIDVLRDKLLHKVSVTTPLGVMWLEGGKGHAEQEEDSHAHDGHEEGQGQSGGVQIAALLDPAVPSNSSLFAVSITTNSSSKKHGFPVMTVGPLDYTTGRFRASMAPYELPTFNGQSVCIGQISPAPAGSGRGAGAEMVTTIGGYDPVSGMLWGYFLVGFNSTGPYARKPTVNTVPYAMLDGSLP